MSQFTSNNFINVLNYPFHKPYSKVLNFNLKRTLHGMQSVAVSGVKWQVLENDGTWNDYSLDFCDVLEQARKAGETRVRKDSFCEVDIVSMLQLDAQRGSRKLKRVLTNDKYTSHTKVSVASPNSFHNLKLHQDPQIRSQKVNSLQQHNKYVFALI